MSDEIGEMGQARNGRTLFHTLSASSTRCISVSSMIRDPNEPCFGGNDDLNFRRAASLSSANRT